ncbi:MAG TPA: D-aminoacyl-tRNA deacylase [Pirellulales bacterium]|nr:D-aminoacyl-tRNA deacylase [Pirellulales bacterium]
MQRVREASVTVASERVATIASGMLVLLGVATVDTDDDVIAMVDKLANLRIFDDAQGKMNLAIGDVGGAMLVVSQFTLLGDTRRGRRPSYSDAAPPEQAERQYEAVVAALRARGVPVQTGKFRAMMDVALVNDGPVTLLIDTRG